MCFPAGTVAPTARNTDIFSRWVAEKGAPVDAAKCKDCAALGVDAPAKFQCTSCPAKPLLDAMHAFPHRSYGHTVVELFPFSGFSLECTDHAGAPMFFFCRTDGIPVCANCVLESHDKSAGHDIVKIADAREGLKATLTEKLEAVKSGRDYHYTARTGVETAAVALQVNRDASIRTAKETAAALRQAVDVWEAGIVDRIKVECAKKDAVYKHQQYSEDAAGNTLQLASKVTASALDQENVVTLSKTLEAVVAVAPLVVDRTPELAVSATLQLDVSATQALVDSIMTLGRVVIE